MLINQGQSVIEVIVAVSIMVMIAAASVSAILGSFSSSRLAQEEIQAVQIAAEGLEAVRSIRDQSWTSLADGSYGLINNNGIWGFSGSSDQLFSPKFTRVITINSGPAAGSKIISSQASWNFTPLRQNTVAMTTILTDWQITKSSSGGIYAFCNDFCINQNYSAGMCRQNATQCNNSGEIYESAGDIYCVGGANADTCCCAP